MAKKQKKQYAPWVIAVVAVCLLIELVGMIPGIPFNGWTDVLNWFGMPQTAIAPEGELNVHFIDLGNADCILVRQGEHNMLIDAGDLGDEQEILEYLHNYGVEKFDIVIATHPHADHIGEMAAVLENFPVQRFVMAFMPEGKEPTSRAYLNMLEVLDKKNIPIDEAVPGDIYTLGMAQLQILAPISENSDPNAMSVVTRLTFGERSFVFTGDAEAEQEREILTKGYNVKADVLKAGHHGSKTSTSDPFLRAVSPRYVVITCGVGNSYGHPHNETIDRLEDANVPYYRTDELGSIVFATDGTSLTVQTEKGGD